MSSLLVLVETEDWCSTVGHFTECYSRHDNDILLTLRRLESKSDHVKTARIIHSAQRTCTLFVKFPTLASSEFASVLATSGTTGAEADSIGTSWKFDHFADAFSTHRKSEAVVAVADNFDLSGDSAAAFCIEHVISWNDAGRQIDEYGDDDDEYYEVDVD